MNMTYPFNTDTHVRLENIRFYEEREQLSENTSVRNFYLEVSYLCENEKEVRQVVYPKIELPIIQNSIPEIEYVGFEPSIDFGFGPLNLKNTDINGQQCYVYSDQVKTKTIDMTVEEIEAKLGHKIRIVAKEENKK